jgi:hypothetical protein
MADLATPDIVLQIGVVPRRIDVLTSITAVSFDDAWPHRKCIEVDNIPISVIGHEELLRNKRNTGRTKDRADAGWLEAHLPTTDVP